MHNKSLIAAVMAAGALALGGCSSTPTNAQVGATAGAVICGVVGAGAGAAVGHEIGKRVK